ncbi:hypothetical protein KEM56_004225, partial [Ascosphaera pollenicola]
MAESQSPGGAGQQQASLQPSTTGQQTSGLHSNTAVASGNAQAASSGNTGGDQTQEKQEASEDVKMEGVEETQNLQAQQDANTSAQSAQAAQARSAKEEATDMLPPSKKATVLREFLGKMDEYAPIIPDAVTAHYLSVAGLPPPGSGPNQTPPYLARLLALATQKFIADVATDAYQYARIRASNSSSASNPVGTLNVSAAVGAPAAAGGGAGGAGGESSGGSRKNAAN